MWVAKIRMPCENFTIGHIARQFQIDIYGYPLMYEKKKNHLELKTAGIFIGEKSKKRELIQTLKKNKKFIKVEEQKGFFLTVTKQPLDYEKLFTAKIMRVKPDFISREGYHIWEVASWDRKSINQFISFAKKHHNAKILKLREEKLDTITFHKPYAQITDKQKEALEFAIDQGYYEFPRKVSLHELAQRAKQPYATFQEHLRKAESKIIPFFKKM